MTRSAKAPKSKDAAKVPDTFFDQVPAAKAMTNVRVVEGMVYVIDDTNDLSLLSRGESVRVVSKKPVGPAKLPKDVLESNAKFAAAIKGLVPAAVTKDHEPTPLTVVKEDPPKPLSVAKADEPIPLTVVKADLAKDLEESKAAKPLPIFAKDFASLAQSVKSVAKAPKEAIVSAAVSAVTENVLEKKMNPSDLRYATLRNPGAGVFVKRPGGEWEPAKKEQVVLPGDLVKTAETGSVDVLLDNGKTGRVEVKPGSFFRISKAETDPVSGDKSTMLDLAVGKVLVHASKLQGNSKFEVRTPTTLTGVRGTVFEVVVKERPQAR